MELEQQKVTYIIKQQKKQQKLLKRLDFIQLVSLHIKKWFIIILLQKNISRDVGSGDGKGAHNGGVWKMANSIKDLGRKEMPLFT